MLTRGTEEVHITGNGGRACVRDNEQRGKPLGDMIQGSDESLFVYRQRFNIRAMHECFRNFTLFYSLRSVCN